MHGVHRPGQRQVGEVHALFDQVEHQRRGAELEVGRRLGEVRVADDDVQPPVLVGVGVRLVAGVDDAALERGLQADLDLDVVGALRQLEAGLVAGRADADPARAGDHLAGHQERRQAGDDGRERRLARHQVVLVRAVGGALAVHVVLVELQLGRAGHAGDVARGGLHHPLAGLVPDHRVHRVGALGRGVLRVRVVDVEPRAVGQDHVGRADLVGVHHRRRARRPAQVEPAGVAQRRFHLVVPAGALGPLDPGGGRVRQHRLRRRQDRIRGRVGRRRDAVLDLGPDNPLHVAQPRGRARSSLRPCHPSRATRPQATRFDAAPAAPMRPPACAVARRRPADVGTEWRACMIDVTQRRAADRGSWRAACPRCCGRAPWCDGCGRGRRPRWPAFAVFMAELRARRRCSPASTPSTSTATRLARNGSSWRCSCWCFPLRRWSAGGVAHLDGARPDASRRPWRWPSRSPAAFSAARARGSSSTSSSRAS